MKTALAATAIVATAIGFALREQIAGTPAVWFSLGVPYTLLAAYSLHRLHTDGTLRQTFQLRAGDFTIGFGLAALLFGGTWLVKKWMFGGGSPRVVWLLRIAIEVGNVRPSPGLLVGIAMMASLEEIVWRGAVLNDLTDAIGTRLAWVVAAILYAVAHLPSLVTLGDSVIGPNPLLVVAAFGAGLVWSFAASMLARLPPIIVSHAVFSYFAVTVLLPHFT